MSSTCVIVNHSTKITDADVDAAVLGVQKWARDVGRAWDSDVPAVHRGTPTSVTKASFGGIILQDGLDVPGALGYHDVIAGRPTGLVDITGTESYGGKWQVTLTHELAEMMVDPWCIAGAPLGTYRWVAQELCDPVEDDRYFLDYGGVPCSDFILPAYFSPSVGGQYDHGGKLTGPAPRMLAGGYLSIWQNGKWSQATQAKKLPHRAAASRRHALRVAMAAEKDWADHRMLSRLTIHAA